VKYVYVNVKATYHIQQNSIYSYFITKSPLFPLLLSHNSESMHNPEIRLSIFLSPALFYHCSLFPFESRAPGLLRYGHDCSTWVGSVAVQFHILVAGRGPLWRRWAMQAGHFCASLNWTDSFNVCFFTIAHKLLLHASCVSRTSVGVIGWWMKVMKQPPLKWFLL
jgi:hypothetical protein